jgi:hypothetical protein
MLDAPFFLVLLVAEGACCRRTTSPDGQTGRWRCPRGAETHPRLAETALPASRARFPVRWACTDSSDASDTSFATLAENYLVAMYNRYGEAHSVRDTVQK